MTFSIVVCAIYSLLTNLLFSLQVMPTVIKMIQLRTERITEGKVNQASQSKGHAYAHYMELTYIVLNKKWSLVVLISELIICCTNSAF
jgi:hypothetical protein